MRTYSRAYFELQQALKSIYEEGEATAIAHEVLSHITGMSKLERLAHKDTELTEQKESTLLNMQAELLTAKPLQYILGHAWFSGNEYKVNEQVLIPRPETEELVQWIIDDANKNAPLSLLDVGTGSGCVPIALKLALPLANITSCDISTGALTVAEENAKALKADISLLHLDFLRSESWSSLGKYDIIVSNPPYIPETEKESLHANVRDFEPGTALFVPGNDALLFYRALAGFGKQHLRQDGAIYCELHRDHAVATKTMFEENGYTAELKKDMHGNDRMLKAYFR
jgi:release factor glutamine methyltransferase